MRTLLALSLALFLAASVPAAAATTGTVRTGEVDVHHAPKAGQICLMVITSWEIRLTLLEPALGDAVALVVDAPNALAPSASMATFADPQTSVFVTTTNGCAPMALVGGVLVAGSGAYALDYCVHGC
jgi:hypothetical protein